MLSEMFVTSLRRRGAATNVRSLRQIEEYFLTLGNWCYWCAGPFEVVDHVWPVKLGGSSNMINLVPSCTDCNARKSDLDLPYWCRLIGFPYPLPVGELLG
jgi:5-methylcytosine-specific restriction endonuclease McrA